MTITVNKKSITKFLLIFGSIVSVAMIFAFFGNALEQVLNEQGIILYKHGSIFAYIFDKENVVISPGMIVLFSFQIVLMLLAITYIVFVLFNANRKMMNVLSFIILIILVVAIILAFLTKILIKDAYIAAIIKEGYTREEAIKYLDTVYYRTRLSYGTVSYIVLAFVAFTSLGIGTILNNIETKRHY